MIHVRITNSYDSELIVKLREIVYNEEFFEKNIIKELKDKHDVNYMKNNYSTIIKKTHYNEEQLIKQIDLETRKLNPNNRTNIETRQKEKLINKITPDIVRLAHQEQHIVLVLDNYIVHKAKLVEKICELLNIEIIRLPEYSPHLNPIEQLWKKLKELLSHENIKNKIQMGDIFKKDFYEHVDSQTYTDKWTQKYLHQNIKI